MPSQNHQFHPQSEPATSPQVPLRTPRCRHIFTSGRQCGSPCLRGEQFCYFHHTTRRPVSDPKSRSSRTSVYDLPNPEDRDSIRAAIAQVMHAIAHNNIDPRRAGLILYSLQIALCALPKEPRMNLQSVDLSAAARPATRRSSHRKSQPVSHIPAEPIVEEVVLDDTHGLIARESFLEPKIQTEDLDDEEDYEDEEESQPPRRSLARQLLDEVERYEARQAAEAAEEAMKKAAYEQGRADALKEAQQSPTNSQPQQGIDLEASAVSTAEKAGAPCPDSETWVSPRPNYTHSNVIPTIRACTEPPQARLA